MTCTHYLKKVGFVTFTYLIFAVSHPIGRYIFSICAAPETVYSITLYQQYLLFHDDENHDAQIADE